MSGIFSSNILIEVMGYFRFVTGS